MQRLPGGSKDGAQAAVTAAQRRRLRHIGPTVETEVDVDQLFAEEQPTSSAARLRAAARRSSEEDASVHVVVSLETVPEVAVADTDIPWAELEPLATEVLMRVNGAKNTMAIVTHLSDSPGEGVRVLASLVCRGIVRLAK